ncbi:ATP-grasp domain-containing protein [Niastella caeni]|uniref:ATP-grasp domain-containing protein n=1 Tax=Niastella caeni TaxID=2569763 RepID=UPI0021CE8581|nr:ATP-grasp domain-containing protein [Niastella caeni]
MQLRQTGQLSARDFSTFIKPVVPNIFIAGIFQNKEDFKKVTEELSDAEEILISTIIPDIQAEARFYIMNGVVMDLAFYEGSADLQAGEKFAADFIAENKGGLPQAVVVDITFSGQTGWFVLEFNACWVQG